MEWIAKKKAEKKAAEEDEKQAGGWKEKMGRGEGDMVEMNLRLEFATYSCTVGTMGLEGIM